MRTQQRKQQNAGVATGQSASRWSFVQYDPRLQLRCGRAAATAAAQRHPGEERGQEAAQVRAEEQGDEREHAVAVLLLHLGVPDRARIAERVRVKHGAREGADLAV